MPLLTTFGADSLYGYTSASRTDPYLVTSAYTSTATITIPSVAAVGDIAVLFDNATNSSGIPTSVVPSGWTSVNDTGNSLTRVISSYKLLVSGDPGASITGMSGTDFQSKSLLVFRKTVVATAVSAFSAAGEVTTGNPTAQVVTSSGGVVPIIVIATYYASSITGITGLSFTPTPTGVFNPTNFSRMRYKIFQSAPVDVTVDIGDAALGDNALQSYYLQIS